MARKIRSRKYVLFYSEPQEKKIKYYKVWKQTHA